MSEKKILEHVPMRDGVRLATYIHFPEGDEPWPAMMIRHPYGPIYGEDVFQRMASDGYVAIMQDERGRHGSEGDWEPRLTSGEDGADTCEWIVKQSWSNGRVGLFGSSYAGLNQWLVASQNPRGLAAISPHIGGDPFSEFPYVSPGVLSLGALVGWSLNVAHEVLQRKGVELNHPTVGKIIEAEERIWEASEGSVSLSLDLSMLEVLADVIPVVTDTLDELYDRPLSEFTTAVNSKITWVKGWLDHPQPTDEFWEKVDHSRHYDRIETPSLIVAGWYDPFIRSAVRDFSELTARMKGKHKLVIGPWPHNPITNTGVVSAGTRQFAWPAVRDHWAIGGTSQSRDEDLLKRWFSYWLRDEENGILDTPPIQLYVMGENVVRDEYEWPLARTKWTNYYLQSEGHANTRSGDGVLGIEKSMTKHTDVYVYDPANPVPTCGGNLLLPSIAGSYDQRVIQERQDVLVYTTPVLKEDVEVTGPVQLHLWASTSAVDTDFTAKLIDVFPDGNAYNLCDGVTRLRFRSETPGKVSPGEIQKLVVELGPTSNVFKAGHRIQLEVSSSNFPYFDPNPNTGKSLFTDTTNEMVVAHQTIFHDQERPSHLLLPVIPSQTSAKGRH